MGCIEALIGMLEGVLVTTLRLQPIPMAGEELDEAVDMVVVVEVTVEEEETPIDEGFR